MKLMPASTAVFTCSFTASCCSLPMLAQIPAPPPPYVMVPRHNSETYRPVWPNNRYRMPASVRACIVELPEPSIQSMGENATLPCSLGGGCRHGIVPVCVDVLGGRNRDGPQGHRPRAPGQLGR